MPAPHHITPDCLKEAMDRCGLTDADIKPRTFDDFVSTAPSKEIAAVQFSEFEATRLGHLRLIARIARDLQSQPRPKPPTTAPEGVAGEKSARTSALLAYQERKAATKLQNKERAERAKQHRLDQDKAHEAKAMAEANRSYLIKLHEASVAKEVARVNGEFAAQRHARDERLAMLRRSNAESAERTKRKTASDTARSSSPLSTSLHTNRRHKMQLSVKDDEKQQKAAELRALRGAETERKHYEHLEQFLAHQRRHDFESAVRAAMSNYVKEKRNVTNQQRLDRAKDRASEISKGKALDSSDRDESTVAREDRLRKAKTLADAKRAQMQHARETRLELEEMRRRKVLDKIDDKEARLMLSAEMKQHEQEVAHAHREARQQSLASLRLRLYRVNDFKVWREAATQLEKQEAIDSRRNHLRGHSRESAQTGSLPNLPPGHDM